MKTIPFITLVLLLICFSSFAQNEVILLRPETGKEYFYRFTDSEYIAGKSGEKLTELVEQKTLHIKFSTVQSENKDLLQVKVIQNKAEKPLESPRQVNDYMYPYFENNYFGKRYENLYEELLCDIEFQYEFDFITSEVKLYNRPDVLLKVRKNLQRKEFSENDINRYTEGFNEKGIPELTKHLNSIYSISQDSLQEINEAEKFKTSVSTVNELAVISAKRLEREAGLNSVDIVYNQNENFLKSYNSIKIDSVEESTWYRRNPDRRYYREKNIRLLRRKDISENRFVISGHIKKPRYKKVTLAVLQDPFGYELKEYSVFLDENNSFSIETELNHQGIVLLQFGNTNQSRQLPIFWIYAEPGSKIQLNDNGEQFLENVEFTGDFSKAAQMLHEYQKKFDFNEKYNLENMFWFSVSSKIGENNFRTALTNHDSFLNTYKKKIDETAFEFITHEVKMNLLTGAMFYARSDERTQALFFLDDEPLNAEPYENYIAGNPFNKYYNESGIFSRLAAYQYVNFQMAKATKVQELSSVALDPFIIALNYSYRHSFPLVLELAKVVLSGHAYYSCAADVLLRIKADTDNEVSKNDEIKQMQIDEYYDLFQRLCNNNDLKSTLAILYQKNKVWEDATYVPSNKFLNPEGKEVSFNDFLGDKPTVFYITQRWGNERYYFDELADENPDINFVMVMEGSIFEEWQDYMTRAEPIAHQLFLENTETDFRDIFERQSGYFIIYDKDGVRFAFADDPLDAKNYAKQSLQPKKKELNKSQLQIIIVVLLSILTILIISLLLWKWRVRQQFRKEEQKRRLRELELTAIRSQMNPHFLFNSLNSVQNLVQQNKGREAHLYLSDFAGLIRKVLNNSEKEEVSLAEELEMIRQYLNLEKLRFDFEFEVLVDETIDEHNTQVPSLLLQPFVENAIVHGLQNKRGEKHLKIDVTKKDAFVLITITDNGIGRKAAKEIQQQKNGKGTKLMKERLEILQQKQGEKYALTTTDLEEGTRVEIILPEEN
ncbi:histidine kinase [uncultured Draconibacterium sp.]|uniref:sensor histidine kinase n=1 Tax=uncultured Draconibacterium sp. TaxID=1573823 RepID=UPI0029C77DED|nr:histidine kinase [uncultured Draconibacterium sp.]